MSCGFHLCFITNQPTGKLSAPTLHHKISKSLQSITKHIKEVVRRHSQGVVCVCVTYLTDVYDTSEMALTMPW